MLTQKIYNSDVLHKFLIILNPFAPHISEELNEKIFIDDYSPISDKKWPKFDDNLIVMDVITIAVQINGKTRGTIDIDVDLEKEMILHKIIEDDKFGKYFNNKDIKKEIYVPNRLVNFVIV